MPKTKPSKVQTDSPVPNRFSNFIEDVKLSKKKVENVDDIDTKLAVLAEMDGWKYLIEFMDRRIAELRQLAGFETQGKSLEDIGIRFILADMVAQELELIKRKVSNARKVYETSQKD